MFMRKLLTAAVLAVLIVPAVPLTADDAESSRLAERAAEQGKAGNWRDAAKSWEEAEFTAEDPQLKLNSLVGAAEAWRKTGLLYKEFGVIEKILRKYPTRCDFERWTDREYAIARAFGDGHRDPSFWQLRFIPWLTDPDRTAEVGEQALKHAPFAKSAADLRLKLALLYDNEGKADDSIRHLRAILRDHPEATQSKYALLGLGEMLFFRSKRGDGDGRLTREALAVFEEFRKRYPNASETPYVEQCILKAKDIQSKRLLGIAQFYNRTGRKQAAQQYLNEVLKDYPDSRSASESERLLVKIDREYTPESFLPEVKPRTLTSPRRALPDEDHPLLIAPENSGGKYLLPIYDLSISSNKETEK